MLEEANAARLRTLDLGALDRQRALLENRSYLSRQWLRVLPTQKQHQLADPEVTEALRSRLLLPSQLLEGACHACGSFPTLGHEDVCRGADRRWISRYNQVNRAFIKALSSRPDLEVQGEPHPDPRARAEPRPDFSCLLRTSRYYYDIQIVAVNKDSAREGAFETLAEAAAEKKRKYRHLGASFFLLIFSSGGLIEKETAKTYKGLQKQLGPIASS